MWYCDTSNAGTREQISNEQMRCKQDISLPSVVTLPYSLSHPNVGKSRGCSNSAIKPDAYTHSQPYLPECDGASLVRDELVLSCVAGAERTVLPASRALQEVHGQLTKQHRGRLQMNATSCWTRLIESVDKLPLVVIAHQNSPQRVVNLDRVGQRVRVDDVCDDVADLPAGTLSTPMRPHRECALTCGTQTPPP